MQAINATIHGKGFPVVFLHGFCEDSTMWFPYLNSLTSAYQVICIDLPGFGKSELSQTETNLEQVASEIASYLQSIEIDRAIFIGHSLGGYVALALAEAFPEMVQGIGLFHSSAMADDVDARLRRDKSIEFLNKHPVDKFIRPFIPSLFYSKRSEALKKEIDTAISIGLKSKLKSVIAYTLAMKNRKDRFELWKNLDCHCLFIAGSHDNRVPMEISEKHIEERTKVDGYILPETAHMGMYERPSETLQMIKDYLLKVV